MRRGESQGEREKRKEREKREKEKKKKKKEKEERGERLTGGTHMLTSSKTTVKTSKGVICTVLRVERGNMSGFVVQGGILDFFTSSGVNLTYSFFFGTWVLGSSTLAALSRNPSCLPLSRSLSFRISHLIPPRGHSGSLRDPRSAADAAGEAARGYA